MTAGYVFHHTSEKDVEVAAAAVRHEQSLRQADMLGEVAIEGLRLSPTVADDFLLRHGMGHLMVRPDVEFVDPSQLVQALRSVA